MSIGFLLPLVLLFIVLWMFMIRPQRQRTQAQAQMQDNLRVGDEIITAGGLHANVVSIEGEVVEIELAPETVARLDRRAISPSSRATSPRTRPSRRPRKSRNRSPSRRR